jgi:hypothetical protein
MEYLYIGLIILFLAAIVVIGVTMDKEDLEN